MSGAAMGGAVGGGAASYYAAIANAIKASGAIVGVEPDAFLTIVNRSEAPLIVIAEKKLFGRRYSYLTSYKGLAFYTKSKAALILPGSADVIVARSIWIPG
jgi:hypothetical protein